MRTLLFFFFSLATLSASAQGNIGTFQKISRTKYSLSYPNNWTVDTSKARGADIVIKSPKSDSLDDFRENINIFLQDVSRQNYTLATMGEESEAEIRKVIPDVTIIESKLISTSSQQYYSLKSKGQQGKFALTVLQRVYLKNGTAYVLTFTIKTPDEAAYIPVAQKILNSFTLN